ncbi:MAG: hypothetical protein GY820_27670 [Gammaproteobacteria bacterium]|nr:hypothetical protein [Gammaproteobacteria bacterium]
MAFYTPLIWRMIRSRLARGVLIRPEFSSKMFIYLVKVLQESLVVIYIVENHLSTSASVHDVIGCVFVVNS